MASIAQTLGQSRQISLEVGEWLRENVFGSIYRLLLNLALVWLAVVIFRSQFEASPTLAGVIGGAWLIGLIWVLVSAVAHRYTALSQWLKDRLYNSAISALITLILALFLAGLGRAIVGWAFINANFSADAAVAAASEHTGATWGVIIANLKLFMTGQFENDQLWRVWASVGLVAALTVASIPVYGPFSARLKPLRRILTWAWLISPPILWLLLRGFGQSGLLHLIETRTWGGLLLTLIISVFAIVVSFPLGVLLALGRRSTFQGVPGWVTYPAVGAIAVWGLLTYTLPNWPLVQTPLEYVLIAWPLLLLAAGIAFQRVYKGNVVAAFCTVYIEFVRGVPLITVLFMAKHMLPLFLPTGITFEDAFRAMWGFMLFSAAYLAENVRGGLQSIAKGQYEAASALGLNTFQQYRFIILPQALRVVIPPIVGQFIGLFKDTSLVAIVGLLDILNIANSVAAQPDWLGLRREAFVFVSAVYYIGCFSMAVVSQWLEKRLRVGQH